MRPFICFALLVLATNAQSADKRPKITGIDHVDFYTTSPEANARFYMRHSAYIQVSHLRQGQTQRFWWETNSWVTVQRLIRALQSDGSLRICNTDNCAALRSYLAAKGIKVPESMGHLKERSEFSRHRC